jgi:hypothetical protein
MRPAVRHQARREPELGDAGQGGDRQGSAFMAGAQILRGLTQRIEAARQLRQGFARAS